MVTLPTFLPVAEAARKYGLEEARLRELVEKGKIRAGVVAGEMVVSEEEVRGEAIQEKGLRKEDLPEYQMHAHLKGKAIWIREAERQYKVPADTLSEWCRKGYIRKLGAEGKKVLLDEADVAYCSKIYERTRGQGRRIFNPDGTPYKPKSGLFAL
uniref:Helix-turn-helix domain-containing protein n=1 Tax=Bellilinea caldifistulae TaxID=360411 RepID=A0A7C4L3E0_9CHLR